MRQLSTSPEPAGRNPVCLLLATLAVLALSASTPGVLTPSASAHSFDSNFASARYIQSVDEEGLRVLVVVEMPTLDVLGDFRRFLRDHPDGTPETKTAAFKVQQLELLADRFSLQLNGQTTDGEWTAVDHPANGLGDADFFIYMIERRLILDKNAGERVQVELENRLQPEKVVFMTSQADADDGWRVEWDSTAETLAKGLSGEVVGPDIESETMAKWSTSDALRRVRIVFARGSGE